MKASEVKKWPSYFKFSEWPENTLKHMDGNFFIQCVFRLRELSKVTLIPSKLTRAHVRHENGGSRHCTNNHTRLADATDLHTKSYKDLITASNHAESIDGIGGIGLYFDTNQPMLHIDGRIKKIMWLTYSENGERVYLYRENDPIKFYKKLGELL